MTRDKPSPATPRLRFPEFRQSGAWSEHTAGSLFANRIEPGEAELPIYSVTLYGGMVKRDSLDRQVDDIAEPARNKKAYKDDIAYNMMRMWQGAFGIATEDCMVSPAYIVLSPSPGISPEFFGYLLKLPHSLRLLTNYSHGLTKDRLRLYYSDFARIPLFRPCLPEQHKIVSCLASLDDLIDAHSEKLEALQLHKKGLMQQLFPGPGEARPQRRFPEFQSAGEWEETSLEQLVDIESGGTPSKSNPAFWSGTIPWISAKDMKQLFLDDSEDHISTAAIDDGAKLIAPGTLLMLTRGMTLLKDVPICIARRSMAFNQDVKALVPKKNVDSDFLAFLLLGNKQRLLRMVDIAGHGTGKLNTGELKAFLLMRPKPAEQKRIAGCLSSLDELISTQLRRVAALTSHKKGLMQQLFPTPEVD